MPTRGGLLLAILLAAGCATRYETRGLVLAVEPAAARVTVSHEPIPGFMEGMVMEFTAAGPAPLAGVSPGDRIAFRLTVDEGRTRIDRIRQLSAAPLDAGRLASPVVSTLVAPGDVVPDFVLTDQRGSRLALSALRGSVAVLTFIYTRCPLPDYCPRMISNLEAVRRRFPDRLGRDLALLTVTFDPTHDTPETLRAYAEHYRANVPGWYFLTGSSGEIAGVCAAFGVEYWPDEGLITHTLQTAVVDRDGRLVAIVEGKEYSGRQLGDLVASALTAR